MIQFVARVVVLFLLALVIAIGGIAIDTSPPASGETSVITNYRADFSVSEDGDLRAVETLTVDFPISRHGIFRFFDTQDGAGGDGRLVPKDIQVLRDGRSEPYDVLSERRGRYRNIKIGDPDRTISGSHIYEISYRIEGALSAGEDGTQFYWDVIPSGWTMPIRESAITVRLPADVTTFRCGVGTGADLRACQAETAGSTVRIRTGDLLPNTPVTIRAGLDIPTPPVDSPPWSRTLDPILGRSPVLLGAIVLVALGGAGFGAALSRSVHEKAPAFPLMYAPPEGIGPAQAAYVLTEKVDDKAFVATMMYAAERGAARLTQDGKAWHILATDAAENWDKVDNVTQLTGSALGVVTPGGQFTATPGSVSAGQKLKRVLSSFKADTEGWAKMSGLMVSSGLGPFGWVVLVIAGGLAAFLGVFNPFNISVLAIIPGLFAMAALGVGATGAGTRRTPAGRDLWSKVGGFKRILSTPSAQDRFDFSGRQELYTAYLPWAVAFDCAEEWAKKYRVETGLEPPVPDFLPAYAGAHTGSYVSQMIDSFDATVSSAISSYEATQSSSSGGGGGGFSGGGGGGGGGGGSW